MEGILLRLLGQRVEREAELAALNAQLSGSSSRRHSAFILLYGRRRVGKSTLLKAWAAGSGLPYTYWAADKDLAEVQRRRFYDRFSQTQDPGRPGSSPGRRSSSRSRWSWTTSATS